MATTFDVLFGSGNNTQNEIDLIDVIALAMLPIASTFLFGVTTLTVNVFGSFDLDQTLWSVSTLDISPIFLVAVFSAAWVIATNLMNQSTEQDELEFALIGGAIALPILYELIPAVNDLVMWNDFTQVLAALYVTVAAVVVSYMG
jgi:hypothetical protein